MVLTPQSLTKYPKAVWQVFAFKKSIFDTQKLAISGQIRLEYAAG